MKNIMRVAALLLVACPLAYAQTQPDAAAGQRGGLPPLIDREILFGNPEIAGAQLSPDGKFIAFRKPYKDTMNIWVKRADEPFERARLVTSETRRPVPNFFWSRDGKFILFVKDNGGDENFNVYAVDPAATPATSADAPAARNLTNAQKVRTFIYAVPESEPDVIYVGLNDRDRAWHDLYRVKISTGDRTLLRQNTERLTGWVFDNKDRLRLATRSLPNGDTEVLRIDANGFAKIYSCNVFETCNPVRFHKDDRRVFIRSNKGADADLVRLTLFDPEGGKEEIVEADPLKSVDLGGVFFSDVTDELIFTSYTDDRQRLYFKDKAFEADYNRLRKELPNREIGFASATKDEMLWLISAYSDTEPGETYLFDRRTKNLARQYRVRERLPREHLAEMRGVPLDMAGYFNTDIIKEVKNMDVKRNGSQPSGKGPDEYFTGTVRIDPLFQAPEPARVRSASVTFEPGARTAWHTHPLGQTLIVTSGCGWAQSEGGPKVEIRPGDVVWFPPGEKHWHGATPTTAMTHIAIQEALDGKVVEWMEKVSDEQYEG